MTDIRASREALVLGLLEGDAKASRALRVAAFHDAELPEPPRALVDKVAKSATTVSDDDFAAARASGLGEDEIFEVVVCAAVGQATRQYDAARAALAATRREG
jgi:alkylhydroperoxidase family enzyme